MGTPSKFNKNTLAYGDCTTPRIIPIANELGLTVVVETPDEGQPGRRGKQGLPGEKGADGLSAYEVAVENGFVGTEEEWLLSLVGAPGSAENNEFIAGSSLGGHRMVYQQGDGKVAYATNLDADTAESVLGITRGAVSVGDVVSIALDGQEITEPSWTWIPSTPLFIGSNGLLTQTPPNPSSVAFVMVVGYAATPTTVRVRIEPPIYC